MFYAVMFLRPLGIVEAIDRADKIARYAAYAFKLHALANHAVFINVNLCAIPHS